MNKLIVSSMKNVSKFKVPNTNIYEIPHNVRITSNCKEIDGSLRIMGDLITNGDLLIKGFLQTMDGIVARGNLTITRHLKCGEYLWVDGNLKVVNSIETMKYCKVKGNLISNRGISIGSGNTYILTSYNNKLEVGGRVDVATLTAMGNIEVNGTLKANRLYRFDSNEIRVKKLIIASKNYAD
jgi:cytoskeletal protein CcmA (bactofilin family)